MNYRFFSLLVSCCCIGLFAYGQEPMSIMDAFYDDDYMGCRKNIVVQKNYNGDPTHPHCYKISSGVCSAMFSGVYWRFPDGNNGKMPGADLSKIGFKKITFEMRGETGTEVIEYMAGNYEFGSFSTFRQKAYLKTEWDKFEIDLSGKNLSNVTHAFAWLIDFKSNFPLTEITFYIDNIQFE